MASQQPPAARARRMPIELYGSIVRQVPSNADLYRLLWISRDISTEVLRQIYCVIDFPSLYHSSRTEGPTRCRKLISTLYSTPELCHYVKGIRFLEGALGDLDNIAAFIRLFPNVKWLHFLRSFEREYTEASNTLFGGQNPLPPLVVQSSSPRISASHMDALFGSHPGRYLDEVAWYVSNLDPELDIPSSLSHLSVLHGRPALVNFLYPHCARTLTHMKIVWLIDDGLVLNETVRQTMREGDSALLSLSLHCTGIAMREAIRVPLPRLIYLEWQHQWTLAHGVTVPHGIDEAPADRIKTLIDPVRCVLRLVPALRKLKISWIRAREAKEVEGGYTAPIKALFGTHKALQEVEFSVPRDWPHFSHLQLKRGAEEPVNVKADGYEWKWYR